MWDAVSGEGLRVLSGHTDRITGLAVTPDGSRLLTTSTDHTVRLWDTASGDCVAMMRADDDFRCCAWASGAPGQSAFAAGGKRGIYMFDVRNDGTVT
jgi:WD40 repeat protein